MFKIWNVRYRDRVVEFRDLVIAAKILRVELENSESFGRDEARLHSRTVLGDDVDI